MVTLNCIDAELTESQRVWMHSKVMKAVLSLLSMRNPVYKVHVLSSVYVIPRLFLRIFKVSTQWMQVLGAYPRNTDVIELYMYA